MRNSLSLMGALFVLLFSFTSCIEEENSTIIVPGPETEIGLSEGVMSYRGVESPIVAVYDMDGTASALGTSGTVDYATLIISNQDMKGSGERLTQTGDVIIVNIVKDGPIAGTYRISEWSGTTPEVQFFSNICTGMNFATGAIIDDEGMESGETVITENPDGSYNVAFNMVTYDRNVVQGTWTGDLTPARN